MSDALPATLRLRIDSAALGNNWRALDRLSGKARAAAAVKADAYGLGVVQVMPALAAAGCSAIYVAHWTEVAAVAQYVPASSIAVLHGPASPEDVAFARSSGAVPVINSLRQAQLWRDSGGGRCHVMVDSGINRLGISLSETGDPVLAQLQIDMLMSHLASADEDSVQNRKQLEAFCGAAHALPHRALSLANSAGIALGAAYHFDQTRPGLSLYGGVPRTELAEHIAQVVFPQAAVLQTRQLCAGESVGYNAIFTADCAMRVAVVSLGYADGFLRARGPGSWLEFAGQRLPILGRVSMDMIVVDSTAQPELREGDWLDVPFNLPEVARLSGFSQYELLTTLGHRFARNVS